MASLRTILISAVIIFLSYKLYRVPVPDGASQRFKLRIQFAYSDLFSFTVQWLDYLGIADEVKWMRWKGTHQRPLEGVEVLDTTIDGVPVKVFTPHGSATSRPGIVYFHGGGYIFGSVNTHATLTSYMAREANIVVVSVEYRLVPEHTKKEAFSDCVKVTEYILHHGGLYGIDSGRVVVGGDSAGGNYAAGVAIYLRDKGTQPQLRLQLLIYPAVQNIDLQLPSYQQNPNGPLYSRHLLCLFRSLVYCGSKAYIGHFCNNTHVPGYVRVDMAEGRISHDIIPDHNKYPPYERPNFESGDSDIWENIQEAIFDGYSSPLMAESHQGLPEAYIFTGQHDQLRDEGYLYAHRLRQDGVTVTHYNCPVCWHGIVKAVTKQQDATDAMDTIVTFLKKRLKVN